MLVKKIAIIFFKKNPNKQKSCFVLFCFAFLLFRMQYTRSNKATSKGSEKAGNRKRTEKRKVSKKVYYFTKKLRSQVVK